MCDSAHIACSTTFSLEVWHAKLCLNSSQVLLRGAVPQMTARSVGGASLLPSVHVSEKVQLATSTEAVADASMGDAIDPSTLAPALMGAVIEIHLQLYRPRTAVDQLARPQRAGHNDSGHQSHLAITNWKRVGTLPPTSNTCQGLVAMLYVCIRMYMLQQYITYHIVTLIPLRKRKYFCFVCFIS